MAYYVEIKPELLRWAVDRSGLSMDSYAEPVSDWLSGQKKPTYNQLETFARKAMVPFGYLFLKKPPVEELPAPDFRTRTDDGVRRPSPNLIETLFEMQRRKDWMRDYLTDEGHSELTYVGSASVGDDIVKLATRMRKTIGLADDWADQQSNWEVALKYLREKVEDAGILIFINGVVGNNNYRKLDPEEFQGFVLVDKIAPLIFVNGADFKVAQMFTIAHELAHVWIGQSAIFDLVATTPANFDVENYCNSVAAEFLVPQRKLEMVWPKSPVDENTFVSVARVFKVSPIVIARRAKDLSMISAEYFFQFYNEYMSRERKQQDDESTGGNFWLTQNVRLGRRFGRAVITAALDGRISYTDAYDLTRLYGGTFDKYMQFLQQRGSE